METSGPTSGIAPRPGTAGASAAAPAWRPGQLLQATVSDVTAGRVLLSIGHRQVSAETSLRVHSGQQLTLQVQSLADQPVLRVVSPATATPLADAARLLLPRQGSMAPLLSSLAQLAAAPQPAIPGLVHELVRSMLRHMATPQAVSTSPGLRQALERSGVFLERHLLTLPQLRSATLETDLKADLLRLLQLLRNWPAGGSPSTSSTATQAGLPRSGAAPDSAPGGTSERAGQSQSAAGSEQLRRAVQSTLAPPGPGQRVSPAGTSTATAHNVGSTSAGSAWPAQPAAQVPPPLPGAVPTAQAPARITLDLLNRFGQLRTDLLRQVEAALARLQMTQLAALPRDTERGFLEWLFELPLRRGAEVDLWSLRVFRETQQQQRRRNSATPEWTAQVAFELPGLGPMQVQVRVGQQRVSGRFWAEQRAALALLREHLPELRAALQRGGLEVGELDCQSGRMPAGAALHQNPLISEKA